jgi:DNA-binding CsgD family transcriptional regulator
MELLMANSRGQRLIDRGGGIALKNGRLQIGETSTARQLAEMAAGRSKEHSVAFTATSGDGSQLLMTAIAVSSEQGQKFANHASGTALMLIGGQRMSISDAVVESLQNSFDLTAAEARLAGFLIEGSGVKGYSADRGVSLEAGKFLLKGIYAKTGLSNQTELVAMLREVPLGWGKPLNPSLSEK